VARFDEAAVTGWLRKYPRFRWETRKLPPVPAIIPSPGAANSGWVIFAKM
jgi:hypothetical protein